MAQAVDQFTQTLETLKKPINEVMKRPPGPERWRAAHDMLWLNLSWKNRRTYQEVCEENRITRESVDKFGQAVGITKAEMADKTFRNALNIPVGAYTVIQKADPDVFREKKNASLFFKTFPEYTTREVF